MSAATPCVPALTPAVIAASLFQSGALAGAAGGPSKLVQGCPCHGMPGLPTPGARKVVDDKLFCAVMCCCQKSPGAGASGQNLYQSCVDGVFSSADQALDYKSRYKSEISYVMAPAATPGVPMPLMSQTSGNPTKPTDYWQGRAREQLGDGWVSDTGMVRRPDITVVKDPCLPPTQDNIERIVEMKFGADPNDPAQNRAYERIAGNGDKYSVMRAGAPAQKNEQQCDCDDEGVKKLLAVPSQQSQEDAERRAQTLRTAGKVIAGGGAIAAGVAALWTAAEAAGPWLLALVAL
jgi:hypothetical protein